jgi:YfiH family protein
MHSNTANDLTWFTFDSFERYAAVSHAVSTRLGGVSRKQYQSLNLGLNAGDREQAALENRASLCNALKLNPLDIVTANQVHGTHVSIVTKNERGRGASSYFESIPRTDALVTNTPGIPLMILTADCVAVFLYDPVKKAAGVAHASWKGTLGRISQEMVRVMKQSFGSRPEQMIAGIAPSIGPCCYEVREDVIEPFSDEFPDERDRIFTVLRKGKTHLDLWAANRLQLVAAGLPGENIECAELCTACRTDLFYSYRKERKKTGRIGNIVMIK